MRPPFSECTNLYVFDGDQAPSFGGPEDQEEEWQIDNEFEMLHVAPFGDVPSFPVRTNMAQARFFLGSLALLLCLASQADTLTGKVVHVADGDTITVLDASRTTHTIRLAGIDAPEKRQAFGNASKQSLAHEVAGLSVVVEWTKYDRYQRKVGKVLLDGRDINLAQIQSGMAWHYKLYQREQSPEDRKIYALAEEAAKAVHVGLWSEALPQAPWDFRHKR